MDVTRKPRFLPLLLLLLLLCACAAAGGEDVPDRDTVTRFAAANPAGDGNIAIPGYETLSFKAGQRDQEVYLTNPPENRCVFVMTLTLDDGTSLWTGEALSPGEAFTKIVLDKPLEKGRRGATLRYDCYSLQDNAPLNGAEIKVTIVAE